MLSAHGLFDGVACVADMTAAAHIIRVQNIQTDQLTGCRVVRYAGVGLLSEKGMTGHLVQLFHLRKGFAVLNDLAPNFCCLCSVTLLVLSNFDLHGFSSLGVFFHYSIVQEKRKLLYRSQTGGTPAVSPEKPKG